MLDPHALAEARSLAFHAEVAARMSADATILEMARARVQDWLAAQPVPAYARAWAELLAAPLEQLVTAMQADDPRHRALRQSSPFAGALDPRTRWRIHAETRERLEARR